MKFGPGRWTLIPSPRPAARIRLLCFHHAGGGAFGFRDWSASLRPEVELVAVQLPGRENRFGEPALRNIDAILRDLIPNLGVLLGAPYVVFGHSMGAALGHALTRQLLATSELPPPVRLMVSATAAPGLRPPVSPSPSLTDDELVESLVRLGGTPEELLGDRDLLATFLPTLRADFDLMTALRSAPAQPLDIPITALFGLDDRNASGAEVAAWTQLSTRRSSAHGIPGGHFYYQTARAATLDILNNALESDLRTAAAAVGG